MVKGKKKRKLIDIVKTLRLGESDARVPICLVLDVSESMSGQAIEKLNEGVDTFYKSIAADDYAKDAAEVSIITFGGEAKVIEEFRCVEEHKKINIEAKGDTPIAEAVNIALDMLEERKKLYKAKGIDYHQPWLVLMTDGNPTSSSEALLRVAERTNKAVQEGKLIILQIAIGEYANIRALQRFSVNTPVLRLEGLKFNEFFEWLGKSIEEIVQFTPSKKVNVTLKGAKKWSDIKSLKWL